MGLQFQGRIFRKKSIFGSTSNMYRLNVETLQQMNYAQRIVPVQDFHGRQQLASGSWSALMQSTVAERNF